MKVYIYRQWCDTPGKVCQDLKQIELFNSGIQCQIGFVFTINDLDFLNQQVDYFGNKLDQNLNDRFYAMAYKNARDYLIQNYPAIF